MAGWSPTGGVIAFTSNRDGDADIFSVSASGGEAVNLTRTMSDERAPAWSPDGRKIAFYSNRDGDEEIYIMDADGDNQLRITAHRGEDQFPAWIPPEKPEATLVDFGVAVGDRLLALVGDQVEFEVDLNLRQWQKVELPLSAFGSPVEIEQIRFVGRLRGQFFLDEVELVVDQPQTAVVTDDGPVTAPTMAALEQNFPNPFNSKTTIRLNLAAATTVDLALFDILGRRLATLIHGSLPPGLHAVQWDGRDHDGRPASTGVYLYRLEQDDMRTARKLLLVR